MSAEGLGVVIGADSCHLSVLDIASLAAQLSVGTAVYLAYVCLDSDKFGRKERPNFGVVAKPYFSILARFGFTLPFFNLLFGCIFSYLIPPPVGKYSCTIPAAIMNFSVFPIIIWYWSLGFLRSTCQKNTAQRKAFARLGRQLPSWLMQEDERFASSPVLMAAERKRVLVLGDTRGQYGCLVAQELFPSHSSVDILDDFNSLNHFVWGREGWPAENVKRAGLGARVEVKRQLFRQYGEGFRINAPDKAYDCVVVNWTFWHFAKTTANRHAALKEAKRVLSRRGVMLLVSFPHRLKMETLAEAVEEVQGLSVLRQEGFVRFRHCSGAFPVFPFKLDITVAVRRRSRRRRSSSRGGRGKRDSSVEASRGSGSAFQEPLLAGHGQSEEEASELDFSRDSRLSNFAVDVGGEFDDEDGFDEDDGWTSASTMGEAMLSVAQASEASDSPATPSRSRRGVVPFPRRSPLRLQLQLLAWSLLFLAVGGTLLFLLRQQWAAMDWPPTAHPSSQRLGYAVAAPTSVFFFFISVEVLVGVHQTARAQARFHRFCSRFSTTSAQLAGSLTLQLREWQPADLSVFAWCARVVQTLCASTVFNLVFWVPALLVAVLAKDDHEPWKQEFSTYAVQLLVIFVGAGYSKYQLDK